MNETNEERNEEKIYPNRGVWGGRFSLGGVGL